MAAPFLATQASDGGCSGVGLPSKSPPCCHSEPPERRCPASIQKRRGCSDALCPAQLQT